MPEVSPKPTISEQNRRSEQREQPNRSNRTHGHQSQSQSPDSARTAPQWLTWLVPLVGLPASVITILAEVPLGPLPLWTLHAVSITMLCGITVFVFGRYCKRHARRGTKITKFVEQKLPKRATTWIPIYTALIVSFMLHGFSSYSERYRAKPDQYLATKADDISRSNDFSSSTTVPQLISITQKAIDTEKPRRDEVRIDIGIPNSLTNPKIMKIGKGWHTNFNPTATAIIEQREFNVDPNNTTLPRGFGGGAFLDGIAFYANNVVSENTHSGHEWYRFEDGVITGCIIVQPIVDPSGDTLAVIHVTSENRDWFNEHDIAFVRTLARNLAESQSFREAVIRQIEKTDFTTA